MALISCPECGKEISDKATNCPNCGNPISQHVQVVTEEKDENKEFHRCPHCHSKELHSSEQGFICKICNRKFGFKEALYVTDKRKIELDQELGELLTTKGNQAGWQFYMKETGVSMPTAVHYVNSYIKSAHIKPKNSGCAPVILLFILLAGSLMFIL